MTPAEQIEANTHSIEATFGKLFAERDYYRDRLIEGEMIMSKISDYCEAMLLNDEVHVDELDNFVLLFKFLKKDNLVDIAQERIFKQATGL